MKIVLLRSGVRTRVSAQLPALPLPLPVPLPASPFASVPLPLPMPLSLRLRLLPVRALLLPLLPPPLCESPFHLQLRPPGTFLEQNNFTHSLLWK